MVYVHGLGAAVSRALNVALAIKQNNCGSVDFDVRTATVNLVDDIDYAVRNLKKNWKLFFDCVRVLNCRRGGGRRRTGASESD